MGDTVALENFASKEVLELERVKVESVGSRLNGGGGFFGDARFDIVGVGASSDCGNELTGGWEDFMTIVEKSDMCSYAVQILSELT